MPKPIGPQVDELVSNLEARVDAIGDRLTQVEANIVTVFQALGLSPGGGPGGGGDPMEDPPVAGGWTTFTPSVDTQIIYVSQSTGSDANDGLSTGAPVQTLDQGYALLRDGFPDWMLLLRGDTWTNENLLSFNKSGRSATERMVVGSYGASTTRPEIQTGTNSFISISGTTSFLAFVGLEAWPHTRNFDSTHGVSYITTQTGGGNILFEDCYIHHYRNNLDFEGYSGGQINNITVRRCIIAESFNTEGFGHSQGLFSIGVNLLTVEECVFYHNGWRADRTATSAHAGGTQLTDTSGSFQTDGIAANWTVYNRTDGSSALVTSVDSETQVTHGALSGGTDNDWDIGDVYAFGHSSDPAEIIGDQNGFNHGMYISTAALDTVCRRNIIAKSSSHAFKTQQNSSDLTQDENFLVQNFSWGQVGAGPGGGPGITTATITNNVCLEGRENNPWTDAYSAAGVAWGPGIGNFDQCTFTGNIIAHNVENSNERALRLIGSHPIANLTIDGNIIYDWIVTDAVDGALILDNPLSTPWSNITISNNDIQITSGTNAPLIDTYTVSSPVTFSGNRYYSNEGDGNWFNVNGSDQTNAWWTSNADATGSYTQVTYTDANRDSGTYANSLGLGSTFQDFIDAAVALQKGTGFDENGDLAENPGSYNLDYTAIRAINYIRAGFDLSALPE